LAVPYAFYALKAEEITETDPLFTNSVARGISAEDTVRWNAKFDSYTEVDPFFNGSVAKGITAADTAKWNHKLSVESQNLSNVLIKGNNGGGMQIKNIADPTEAKDVATKAYIDAIQLQITLLEQKLFDIEFNDGNDSISDVDGNFYKIVKIGNQYWMAENLRTTKYNDGAAIPYTQRNAFSPGYCWYNADSTYKNPYGALYLWYTIGTGKLCPTGWHVSSSVDWNEIINYAGGASIAGGKLKENGTSHWISPNTGGNNDFGFSALPGGVNYIGGHMISSGFVKIGEYGIYWSTDFVDPKSGASYANAFRMYNNSSAIIEGNQDADTFASIRCVKD
jgi:uncharacterized protein (TIGR02145 family)